MYDVNTAKPKHDLATYSFRNNYSYKITDDNFKVNTLFIDYL